MGRSIIWISSSPLKHNRYLIIYIFPRLQLFSQECNYFLMNAIIFPRMQLFSHEGNYFPGLQLFSHECNYFLTNAIIFPRMQLFFQECNYFPTNAIIFPGLQLFSHDCNIWISSSSMKLLEIMINNICVMLAMLEGFWIALHSNLIFVKRKFGLNQLNHLENQWVFPYKNFKGY